MHKENSFITLTYSDEFLLSPRLIYSDFQKFMKRLRFSLNGRRIGVFVTGEYGEERKRPHWHALVFGWAPTDGVYKYSNHRGDKVYSSDVLDRLWSKGICEFGSVTFESAGYVARYAAKKLVHGDDGHDFEPVSRKSSKHAIGKSFLEVYYRDVFNHGRIVLPDGSETGIPRYYEKWFKENHFEEWLCYVQRVKEVRRSKAVALSEQELFNYSVSVEDRLASGGYAKGLPITRREMESKILDKNFEMLQSHLKGDF